MSSHEEWIRAVRERTGIGEDARAGRALEAVLSVLASALPAGDAAALAQSLPPDLASALRPRPRAAPLDLPALYDAVVKRTGVMRLLAIEETQVILRLCADRLPEELVTRMRKHLSADVAARLTPPGREPAVERIPLRQLVITPPVLSSSRGVTAVREQESLANASRMPEPTHTVAKE